VQYLSFLKVYFEKSSIFRLIQGIGDPEELKKHNITVIVNNPHVGKNPQDHYVAGIMMEINKKMKSPNYVLVISN
jgi:hypothetical protein